MDKKNVFKVLSLIMLVLLVSCGGKSYDTDAWTNDAIKHADVSVKQEEHEMLGKLPYYAACNKVANDTLKKIIEGAYSELSKDLQNDTEEKRTEMLQQFAQAADSAVAYVNQHYESLSASEQKALIGKSLKAASDANVFDSSVTKAEIVGFEGTSKVKIKATLTAKKPFGKFFRMVLANDKMKMVAPFSLMCTPKKAGETFETNIGVPMNMLAQTSILLFDAR